MRFRTLALTAGALIAALVLAGCASTNNSIPSKYYGPGNRSNATLAHTGKASVSSADEVFVMTMIRHHNTPSRWPIRFSPTTASADRS